MDLDFKQVSILVVLCHAIITMAIKPLFMQWIQPNLGEIQLYFLPILPIFAVPNLLRQTANWICRQIGNDNDKLESLTIVPAKNLSEALLFLNELNKWG